MGGARVNLFVAVQEVLGEVYPNRALDPEKTNEIIRLLAQVDEVYESLPLAVAAFIDPALPRDEKPCPFGKVPCHLNNGHCNVSPGLYVVDFEGKEEEMCGECVSNIQGEGGDLKIKGQARSLGGD